MRKAFLVVFFISAVLVRSVGATTYYVSPTGNDFDDGLSSESAWLSLDNGDQTGVLVPGDTVYVLPGTYVLAGTMRLITDGTAADPIVYRGDDTAWSYLNGNWQAFAPVSMEGKFTRLERLNIYNSQIQGMFVESDSCVISDCYVHNNGADGIYVHGSYNCFKRNVFAFNSESGLDNDPTGEYNEHYNNVFHGNGLRGLYIRSTVVTGRAINNVFSGNNLGFDALSGNVCAFNCFWNNTTSDYGGGATDSAGSIYVDPLFVDPASGDFSVQATSPVIDAGIDIGDAYTGNAPDIGAVEYAGGRAFYVSPVGDDGNDGLSIADAWASIDNGEITATLQPGDTVNILAGTYVLSTSLSFHTDGTAAFPIIYRAYENASVLIDGDEVVDNVIVIDSDHVFLEGLEITAGNEDGIMLQGDSCRISDCYIHEVGKDGLQLEGSANLILRNIVARCNSQGINNRDAGENNRLYGNTIVLCDRNGIECQSSVQTLRAFNNIIAWNDKGIHADVDNVCGFNDLWDNANGHYDGPVDSAGGISADPLFMDTAASDFRLASNSPAVDAGMDLGYTYLGTAPDMGAHEIAGISSFEIVPEYDSLFADSTYQFEIVAVNNEGDTVAVDNPVWTHTFATGSIDATGLFTPDLSGSGRIVVSDTSLGLTDSTIFLEVVSGSMVSLAITPDRDTVSADSTRQFSVTGYDANGNEVSEHGSLTWQVIDGIGLIDATGLFEAQTAGVGFIRVSSDLGPVDTTDTIWVIPGDPVTLRVTPEEVTIHRLDSVQFSATGKDSDSNLVSGLTSTVTWSTSDVSGSVSGTGLYKAGVVYGWYWVVADHGGLSDSARVHVSNFFTHVQIQLEDGTVVGDTTLATDNDTTVLYARGYSDLWWELGDVSVSWFLIGADGIGHLSDSVGTSTTMILTKPGTGRVVARSSPTIIDSTGVITCTAGHPAKLSVSPTSATLTTDSSLQFYVKSLDADGNQSVPAVVPAWSVLGDIGTISTGGLFSPTTVGSGWIVASGGGLADTVGPIVVTVGSLSYLVVLPDSAVVSTDSTLQYEVLGYDADGNERNAGTITWDLTASLGTIGTDGLFEATTTGTGQVTASSDLGVTDSSAYLKVVPGELASITISPDSAILSADSTLQYEVVGYDADGNERHPGTITWNLTASLGTIDTDGLFEATTVGTGQVTASSNLGAVDSSAYLEVVVGDLARLAISPDSAIVSADSTLQYEVLGYDADDNQRDMGTITWDLTASLGTIGTDGLFEATTTGTGQVTVSSDLGVTDSSAYLEVVSGELVRIVVSPDTAAVSLGDSVQFSVTGYDADSNVTSAGEITWRSVGRIGSIDTTGLFIASRPGNGQIRATSNIRDIADSSGTIQVDELHLTTIALGQSRLRPNQADAVVLAFRIENYFDHAKTVTDLTVRDASRGVGTAEQRLSNVDSIALYLDIDNDSLLSGSDSLLVTAVYDTAVVNLPLGPLTIGPDSGRTLLVTVTAGMYPRDGDSIDLELFTATDITTADATTVVGPDTANSLGYAVFDGSIAAQYGVVSTGVEIMSPGDTVYNVMILDVPRNGYAADELNVFTVTNMGTAQVDDIDSLVLYVDDGNGVWGGSAEETRLGELSFTGSQWTLSGLSTVMTDTLTRFYLAAGLAAYPVQGATVAFEVPIEGVRMSSGNDGPIDIVLEPADTISIQTEQALTVANLPLLDHRLTPGEYSDPIMCLRLKNSYANSVSVDSLLCQLVAADPDGADQSQLDSQIDSLMLYADLDGNPMAIGAADTLVASALVSDGRAVFVTDGFTIGGVGDSLSLSVVAAISLANAKNGNRINISIDDSTDVYTSDGERVTGVFPVTNPDDFTVDAFPSAAVTVNEVEGSTLFGGCTVEPVLDIELPRDGYAVGHLKQITLVNIGTFEESSDLMSLRLWFDAAADGFDGDEELVGQFVYNGLSWTLAELSWPLNALHNRMIVTASIGSGQFKGGTLQFRIPRQGIEYLSGTIGPDDVALSNPSAHLVLPSDRITVISIPASSVNVLPGSAENVILTFALYNGYVGQEQTLQTLRLTNTTRSVSTMSFADYEVGQVSLYYDADNNRLLDGDPLAASASFYDGELQLSGLNIALPPESLLYFWVLVDVPQNVIDSDSLAVVVPRQDDIIFSSPVNINGDLPLTSGAYLVVDGSIAAQYNVRDLPARTLSPGDTSVTLFSFRPAFNGDQTDFLQSLRLANLADADTSDISSLELWKDNDASEDWSSSDLLLGTFTYTGTEWNITTLDLAVNSTPPVLFVVGDVAASAAPGAEFQGEIPINGCQYASANDGPHDAALSGENRFTISNSSLRAGYEPLAESYSVGQTIAVHFNATNLLPIQIDDVQAQVVGISDSELVVFDSSASGPVAVSSGTSAEFVFYYTALQPGEVSWQLRAVAESLPDSSAVIQTSAVHIQTSPADVLVELINSMPTSVTRGQSSVFPMSIAITHPDTAATGADLRLDSLVLRVEDGFGTPQAADEALSRVVIAAGYVIVAAVEEVPHTSDLLLTFTEPVLIAPGKSSNLMLIVSIDSAASASSFALALESAASTVLVDANTLLPVSINPAVSFPLRTASCRLDDPSQALATSSVSLLGSTANYGQNGVEAVMLRFRHGGDVGTSQIQLSGLSFCLADLAGDPVEAAAILQSASALRQQVVVGHVADFRTDSTHVNLSLTSPLTLSAGEIDSLTIILSLVEETSLDGFSLLITDSTCFTVRDLSSGSPLQVSPDTMLATGDVFPIRTGWTQLRYPAGAPQLCVTAPLSAAVVGGVDSLVLMELALVYPFTTDYSSVRIGDILVSVLDADGTMLRPEFLFDRVGISIGDAPVTYQSFIEPLIGAVTFEMGTEGVLLNPGDSVTVGLYGDIEADVPYDNFVLEISASPAITVRDASDTTRSPGIEVADGCADGFPFRTEETDIFQPAGRPVLSTVTAPVQLTCAGQTGLIVFSGDLEYDSPTLEGDLVVASWQGKVVRRYSDHLEAGAGAEIFRAVHLVFDDEVVATDSVLNGDTLLFTIDGGYDVSSGGTVPVSVVCDVRDDARRGDYLILFEDSTSFDIADKNMATAIYPVLESGTSYPLYGTEISITEASLGQSFTNYPNPFNPAQDGATTIGYVLSEDAHVDIELFSITGEAVKTVAENAFREAGSQQTDIWSGDNDAGCDVVPGTYFCRITAHYVSGRTEEHKRKIAIIR